LRFSRHLAAHTAAAAAAAARRAQGAEEEEEEDSVRVWAPKGGRSQNLKLVLQNQVYVGMGQPFEIRMNSRCVHQGPQLKLLKLKCWNICCFILQH
jgi:hypothetical protein